MAEDPHLLELLAAAGPDGSFPCACGRVHALGTREVLLGPGALSDGAALLGRRRGHAARLWYLSDEHTEAAAGARCKRLLPAGHVSGRILPATPRPVPTLTLGKELAREARASAPDLLVGVGGGVVSDLVKWLSLELGVPSWCVATSAAVDAFTSGTAALRVGGRHRSLPARPSEVVICDLDVLAAAPPVLFLSGLGDLLGKWLGHLDWQLAHQVAGEFFCPRVAGLTLAAARDAFDALWALEDDRRAATAGLARAVLASGLAMQALGSSRPAASAEHTVAHAWEVDGAVPEELRLHGLLVGAASRRVLRGYQAWYHRLPRLRPDPAGRAAALASAPDEGERLAAAHPRLRPQLLEERRPAPDAAALARHAAALEQARPGLLALAAELLRELEGAAALLDRLGFPFAPARLGLDAEAVAFPLRHVRLLRSRYTTFDLAHELGDEPALVAAATAPEPPPAPVASRSNHWKQPPAQERSA